MDQPTESAVEGEIRELVRRDVATFRRAPDAESQAVANNIDMEANNTGTLLQRIAGSSVQEIDALIGELQAMRQMLQAESARVQREITKYAHLSQSTMQASKIISDSLSKWKAEATRGVTHTTRHSGEPPGNLRARM